MEGLLYRKRILLGLGFLIACNLGLYLWIIYTLMSSAFLDSHQTKSSLDKQFLFSGIVPQVVGDCFPAVWFDLWGASSPVGRSKSMIISVSWTHLQCEPLLHLKKMKASGVCYFANFPFLFSHFKNTLVCFRGKFWGKICRKS